MEEHFPTYQRKVREIKYHHQKCPQLLLKMYGGVSQLSIKNLFDIAVLAVAYVVEVKWGERGVYKSIRQLFYATIPQFSPSQTTS